MAPHSSTLAWKIPWMEEPGRLQSMGSLRLGHDWVTSFTFHFHALEKAMATHSSVLAWRIPGTGEPGGLPSVGSHRVRYDWSDLAAAQWHLEMQQQRLGKNWSYCQAWAWRNKGEANDTQPIMRDAVGEYLLTDMHCNCPETWLLLENMALKRQSLGKTYNNIALSPPFEFLLRPSISQNQLKVDGSEGKEFAHSVGD